MQKLEPGPVKEIPEQPGLERLHAACEGILSFAATSEAGRELAAALAMWDTEMALESVCMAGAKVLAEFESVGAADELLVRELRSALEPFMRLPSNGESSPSG